MRMISWTEERGYDIGYDCVMARITGFDEMRQAHWMMIEGHGKGYRDRREEALEHILKHINADSPAGEVSPHLHP